MADLKIHLFGPPRIFTDGVIRAIGRRKATALLAYLAVTRQPHSRDSLAALLWPEVDQQGARALLRRTLVTLNQAIGKQWLQVEEDRISLPDAPRLWIDIRRFQDSAATWTNHRHGAGALCEECLVQLTEAAQLYQDSFLAGFTLTDAPDFDSWASFQAESLQRMLAGALEQLARAHAAAGRRRLDLAIEHGRRWLNLDSLHEPAHRLLMQLHLQAGDRAAAVSQYESCVRILRDELGVDPEPETIALYEQIRAGAVAERAGEEQDSLSAVRQHAATGGEENAQMSRESSQSVMRSLPAQATPFIGRIAELAKIAQLLGDSDCRLLTVLGPGGIGKTRLAVNAAQEQSGHFADGVCFVDLAAVAQAADVPAAILRALSITPSPTGDTFEQLLSHLQAQHMLLVLDNLEHLVSGIDLLPRLLAAAPGLKLLATSRERLNLREEWLLPLEGLDAPPPIAPLTQGVIETPPPQHPNVDLERYDATRLFVRSVARIKPMFQPNSTEAQQIVAICNLLEGMPLGIELAAAWARSLSLVEIEAALRRSLDMLTSPLRDLPARHRSMRAVFDHSWALLDAHARSVLRQLSVFHNGCTAHAAMLTAQASLTDLADLVDKSWLRTHTPGRYDMHELVRQYCTEKLDNEHEAESGETGDQVRQRHSAYFTAWAKEQEEQHPWRSEVAVALTAEFANLLAAWRWTVEYGALTMARSLLQGLVAASDLLGASRMLLPLLAANSAVLRRRLTTELAGNEAEQADCRRLLAWTIYMQAWLHIGMGQLEYARQRIDEVLELARQMTGGNEVEELQAEARYQAAYLHRLQGRHAAALRELHDLHAHIQGRGLTFYPHRPEIGDRFFVAEMNTMLGLAERSLGHYAQAEEHIRHSIALRNEMGEKRFRAWDIRQLALVRWTVGDYDEARALVRQAQVIEDQFGDRVEAALSDWLLGEIELTCHNLDAARTCFERSLAVSRASGGYEMEMFALLGLGRVAFALGDLVAAEDHFHQVVDSYRQVGAAYSNSLHSAWAWLGNVALARHSLEEARRLFLQALNAPAWDLWSTLDVIAGMAGVYAAEDDRNRAIELLNFVTTHPAAAKHTQQRARRVLNSLGCEISQLSGISPTHRSIDEVIAGLT